jgi:predicted transcriptional regulator
MARPRKPGSEKRTRKLVIWLNESEHARYLINATLAALTPADFARERLCFAPKAQDVASDNLAQNPQLAFEYVDALNRVGTSLARLVRLAERTDGGILPELHALMDRLDDLLHRELPS